MSEFETHLLASRDGYTTKACSPGIGDPEKRELEELVHGQPNDPAILTGLQIYPTACTRRLRSSGRFAISRILRGDPDSAGRQTIQVCSLILNEAVFAEVSAGDVWSLLNSGEVWRPDLFASGRPIRLPLMPPVRRAVTHADVLLLDAWLRARSSRAGLATVESNPGNDRSIASLGQILMPRDRIALLWGVRQFGAQTPISIASLIDPSCVQTSRRSAQQVLPTPSTAAGVAALGWVGRECLPDLSTLLAETRIPVPYPVAVPKTGANPAPKPDRARSRTDFGPSRPRLAVVLTIATVAALLVITALSVSMWNRSLPPGPIGVPSVKVKPGGEMSTLEIAWEASSTPPADSFLVEWRRSGDPEWQTAGETSKSSLDFSLFDDTGDKGCFGRAISFRIWGISGQQVRTSDASECFFLVPPGLSKSTADPRLEWKEGSLHLNWRPVPGAVRYRVQVQQRDPSPRWDELTTECTFDAMEVRDSYTVKLTAFGEALRRDGTPISKELEFDAKPVGKPPEHASASTESQEPHPAPTSPLDSSEATDQPISLSPTLQCANHGRVRIGWNWNPSGTDSMRIRYSPEIPDAPTTSLPDKDHLDFDMPIGLETLEIHLDPQASSSTRKFEERSIRWSRPRLKLSEPENDPLRTGEVCVRMLEPLPEGVALMWTYEGRQVIHEPDGSVLIPVLELPPSEQAPSMLKVIAWRPENLPPGASTPDANCVNCPLLFECKIDLGPSSRWKLEGVPDNPSEEPILLPTVNLSDASYRKLGRILPPYGSQRSPDEDLKAAIDGLRRRLDAAFKRNLTQGIAKRSTEQIATETIRAWALRLADHVNRRVGRERFPDFPQESLISAVDDARQLLRANLVANRALADSERIKTIAMSPEACHKIVRDGLQPIDDCIEALDAKLCAAWPSPDSQGMTIRTSGNRFKGLEEEFVKAKKKKDFTNSVIGELQKQFDQQVRHTTVEILKFNAGAAKRPTPSEYADLIKAVAACAETLFADGAFEEKRGGEYLNRLRLLGYAIDRGRARDTPVWSKSNE
jgi:hypothetical protein